MYKYHTTVNMGYYVGSYVFVAVFNDVAMTMRVRKYMCTARMH